jgi:bifunctional non-homologous end joining protein LigD
MRQGLKHLEQRDSIKPAPTNTSVAAYSPRRRPNAPVSVPIAWKELDSGTPPDRFTALTVKARLSRRRSDPWQDYWHTRQRIPARVFEAVVGRL